MSIVPKFTFLTCVAALAVSGCKRPEQAILVAPTRAELSSFKRLEPTLTITVGVEGADTTPRERIVPIYHKVEPTPAERAILGEAPQPAPTALAFYRPPRGPEQGVSNASGGARVGVGGIGGALVGWSGIDQRYGLCGRGGTYAFVGALPVSAAGVDGLRGPTAEVGPSWTMEVGEGAPRRPARHESHIWP
jgi:hypothetical protein